MTKVLVIDHDPDWIKTVRRVFDNVAVNDSSATDADYVFISYYSLVSYTDDQLKRLSNQIIVIDGKQDETHCRNAFRRPGVINYLDRTENALRQLL